MARTPRALAAVDTILDRIVSGEFSPGSPLPPEEPLAELLNVSRPTMREAVTILRARGVLDVRHGRGTFVNEFSAWTDMPTLMRALSHTMSARELGLRVVEVRRMLEVGSAGLAARNRSEEDVAHMRALLARFDKLAAAGDFEAVAQCDIDLHEAILTASGNPFIAPVLVPLGQALYRSRLDTTLDDAARERARTSHAAIVDAIEARDETAAKEAMRQHMTQTRESFESHS